MRSSTYSGLDLAARATINGDAYRISKRETLSDGQEFTIFIDPVESGGTVYLEPFSVTPDARALVDVFENPTTGATSDDLFVHNMRYDGTETPQATVLRVNDGELTTTNADQTEQTLIRSGSEFQVSAAAGSRVFYRIIPVGESIAIRITDDSGGANNTFAFDGVMYEGDTLPP